MPFRNGLPREVLPRSHALRGNVLSRTLRVPRVEATRSVENRRSHAERGNESSETHSKN